MIPALERDDLSSQRRIEPFARIAISERDRRIVALARRKLGGTRFDFGDAVRALREAVEELIPAGRIFVLGAAELTPVVGSLVSGVGITAGAEGVVLVRMEHGGRRATLGRFSP
ncbi:hypothetical protein BE08_15730 [Sorangium cellulosum]|uniref:Uncharacterized protein n=1 Tax=Sorangium cellulosum TaxID=56 RepID=A0A150PMK2_SORCE|nr:hypothetical protein BE08_15730 [Sorangium cellulosum]